MKLGLMSSEKYKKCKICNKTVLNTRHSLCNKYYNKKQERKEQNEKSESIKNYFIPTLKSNIKNIGYVDPVKYNQNIRLLSLNPRGFGPDSNEKIAMLKLSKERLQFDGVFFSSPDRNWNSRRIELIRRKLNGIGRNIKINTSDTQIEINTKNGYLPGGTISIVWDNLADLVIKTWNKDKLGRWSSILIGRENRVIEIITIYRLVESTEEGIITSHAQYNTVLGKHNTARQYRQTFLQDLGAHMQNSIEALNVRDILVLGDMNQHI